jgi:hypothetical protein
MDELFRVSSAIHCEYASVPGVNPYEEQLSVGDAKQADSEENARAVRRYSSVRFMLPFPLAISCITIPIRSRCSSSISVSFDGWYGSKKADAARPVSEDASISGARSECLGHYPTKRVTLAPKRCA